MLIFILSLFFSTANAQTTFLPCTAFYQNNCVTSFAAGTNITLTVLNQVLTISAGGGGSGSVTSVGLSTPGVLYSVSGSPVTTAGTLALNLISQAQNTVLAGPTSGSGNPSFRALVAGDLPSSGTGAPFVQGGNSFGAVGLLGTNDANNLNIETNGAVDMTLATSGYVGIGTTTPAENLEVVSIDGNSPRGYVESQYYTGSSGAALFLRHARGTLSSPLAISQYDSLGGVAAEGYGTSQWSPSAGGMSVIADQAFTNSANGTDLVFSTTPDNSTTIATVMWLGANGGLSLGPVLPVNSAGMTVDLPLGGVTGTNQEGINVILNGSSTGTTTDVGVQSTVNVDTATLSNLEGFQALPPTLTNGAAVTTAIGYFVPSGFNVATNNRAFQSSLAAATGNWNLYMSGTAQNYFAGNVGVGISNPVPALEVDRATLSGTPSITGALLSVAGTTFTDNNTAGSGTAAVQVFNNINTNTLAATNSSVTTTNAYNLLISGAPVASTNESITQDYGLRITTANVGAGVSTSTALRVDAMTGGTNNYAASFNGGNVGIGTNSPGQLLAIAGAQTGTPAANGSIFNMVAQTFTDNATAGSGTAAKYYQAEHGAATLAATNSSVTTTRASNTVINGAVIAGSNESITTSVALDILAQNVTSAVTTSVGLSVAASTVATNNYAATFTGGNVGIGTAAPTQALHVVGHINLASSAPTVSSCGSGSLTSGSSDNKGVITGVTTATACTITFSSALPAAPSCLILGSAAIVAPLISSLTTTAVTFGFTSYTGTLYYICF